MRTKYKQWAVDYLVEHPELVIEKIDLNDPFFTSPIELEIGSGKGDFIISLASRHLSTHFLAVERTRTIAGMMAKKITESELLNIRVIPLDVEVVLSSLPNGSVNKIYLNFSDPWPKKRHEKRRLTYIKYLNRYYELLKDGSFIYIKTDNDSLFEFTKEQIALSKFKLIKEEFDYVFDNADAMSEYEAKFRASGNKIHRIIIQK